MGFLHRIVMQSKDSSKMSSKREENPYACGKWEIMEFWSGLTCWTAAVNLNGDRNETRNGGHRY